MSPPICKPDKSNGLEFRFDLPFSCQASAKTLLHLVLFSSMCRLIPYLVPGGPSANTESASDFPTGGFIRFFRRCSHTTKRPSSDERSDLGNWPPNDREKET